MHEIKSINPRSGSKIIDYRSCCSLVVLNVTIPMFIASSFFKLISLILRQQAIIRPTFFYYLFYGIAYPIFVKKRIKIKVHDCCFIFIYSSDSRKNPSAKNKRKSVANFDWRNQKPAANHQLVFSPGIRRNYLGFAFNSDGGPK